MDICLKRIRFGRMSMFFYLVTHLIRDLYKKKCTVLGTLDFHEHFSSKAFK